MTDLDTLLMEFDSENVGSDLPRLLSKSTTSYLEAAIATAGQGETILGIVEAWLQLDREMLAERRKIAATLSANEGNECIRAECKNTYLSMARLIQRKKEHLLDSWEPTGHDRAARVSAPFFSEH